MNETIILKCFGDIDSNDAFFDSLKEDYPGLKAWFEKKAQNKDKAFFSDYACTKREVSA